MTKLSWGDAGMRFFEAGSDRGVLYVGNNPGVPWNGLVSVNETPSGGEPKPYYLDGIKYLNISEAEEFEASILAFSAPEEFGVCDGTASLANGLYVTQQPRKPFGFTYRTLVGNDTEGLEHGYKIHIVYNARSTPASRANESFEEVAKPVKLSWDITTLPEFVVGHRPSAHFVIDTRQTAQILIDELENILYGTAFQNARMPTVNEIVTLFGTYAELEVMVMYDNGTTGIEYLSTIISATPPEPATGNSTLWLDTSAGDYSVLKQVIGD